jgi:hypothetical protein
VARKTSGRGRPWSSLLRGLFRGHAARLLAWEDRRRRRAACWLRADVDLRRRGTRAGVAVSSPRATRHLPQRRQKAACSCDLCGCWPQVCSSDLGVSLRLRQLALRLALGVALRTGSGLWWWVRPGVGGCSARDLLVERTRSASRTSRVPPASKRWTGGSRGWKPRSWRPRGSTNTLGAFVLCLNAALEDGNNPNTRPDPRRALLRPQKPPVSRSFDAPEWTRTTTDLRVHKALNLARLPIPPQAQRGRV